MKRIIVSLVLTLSLIPCFSQGVLKLDIREFSQEGDSLKIVYAISSTTPNISTSEGLSIRAMLQAGDSTAMFPAVTLLGNNKFRVLRRYTHNSGKEAITATVNSDRDEAQTQSLSIAYREWMDSARLVICQEVAGYRGHKVLTQYSLNELVKVRRQEPDQLKPHVALLAPPKEEKYRSHQYKAYFEFAPNSFVIEPAYRDNEAELQKINHAFKDVINNPDALLLGVQVQGFASPEGPYADNEMLARNRANALQEYIHHTFSLPYKLFDLTFVAEDWEGLQALIQTSDLPSKKKILDIISSVGIFEGREGTLMRLEGGKPYRRMVNELCPPLRRVEYRIDYKVRNFSVDEASKQLEKNPDNLSQYELYQLAQSLDKHSNEYRSIMQDKILNQFPNDSIANNNAAAQMIVNGDIDAAKHCLDKAGNSPEAINNRGVVALLEGDMDKAQNYFNAAQKGGCQQALHNISELQKKRKGNENIPR